MRRFLLLTAAAAALMAPLPARAGGRDQLPPAATLRESLSGRDNFGFYCASCHGPSGRGDGALAAELRTRPADLTTLSRRSGGRFPRERVAAMIDGMGRTLPAHGTTDMPVWGPIFRAFDPSAARVRQRIDNLVAYLESIQQPTTAGGDPGAQLFRTHCASCHGTAGRGNGPLAEQLRHAPPDLTQYTARNGGVFPRERIFRIVEGRDVPSHGDREMPVWGDVFLQTRGGDAPASVKARIDAIVRYLESIQARGAE